jgi:hypothetical protein
MELRDFIEPAPVNEEFQRLWMVDRKTKNRTHACMHESVRCPPFKHACLHPVGAQHSSMFACMRPLAA